MLPPNLDRATFDAAIQKFRAVVGAEWVFTSDDDVSTYRDFYSPLWGEAGELVASAAVAPATVEQVQAIVRIANAAKVPLYPISTGKNLGYGGSAPTMSGSVVVDLKRMNRIVEIDERRQFVVVEPGVSYFDLYRHIQDKGLKLWIDCPDPGWGSVMGNALDRGGGYTGTTFRDHFGSHCGMEVVMPDGDLVRTGPGARSNAGSWQDHRYGLGPHIDGLFSQGNYGIVTKMGFWLMPQPEAALAATVTVPGYYDIIPLSDTLTRLENAGIVNGLPDLISPVFGIGPGTKLDARLQQLVVEGRPAADFLAAAGGKPYWALRLTFLGPDKVNAAKWEYARQEFSKIPGSRFENEQRYAFPMKATDIAALQPGFGVDRRAGFGIPSMEIFMLGARSPLMPNPSHGHIWLSPIVPRTGEAVIEAQRVLLKAMIDRKVPLVDNVPTPFCQNQRSYVFVIPFLTSEDETVNKAVRQTMSEIIDVAAEHGWIEYRAHPIFQKQLMGLLDFGGGSLPRLYDRIKDALDPNGIIAPGRYAIWPKALREKA